MKLRFCISSVMSVPSPSIRREWIEINDYSANQAGGGSPSIRREWIEIASKAVAEK